jgi:AraC-like DNA-binding protein
MSNSPLTVNYITALGFQIWQGSFFNMPQPHAHTDIEVNYLFEGYAHYLHGSQIYELQANSWAIFWGGIPHRVIKKSSQNRGFWLTLPLAWVLQWDLPGDTLVRLLKGEMLVELAGEADRMAYDHYLLALWHREFLSGKPERVKNIILNLEAQLRRIQIQPTPSRSLTVKSSMATAVSTQQFNNILNYITENYATIPNVTTIAEAVQQHPKYLMQLFKKTAGINLWEYIIWLRVAHAQRLLLTTQANIIDIALASGFNSPSTFYQAFKKYTNGTKPNTFRQQKLI